MGFKLDDYQLEAVANLRTGSILCGGVGSGKSRTALYYYYVNVCGGQLDPTYKPMSNPLKLYIITTARKRDLREWNGELLPFYIDPEDVVVDSWENVKKYVDVSGCFFIFDEQRVCGYGVWAKSFIKIAKKNDWILLTATPGDTWEDYIPVFIANGFYEHKTAFMREHAVYNPHVKFRMVDHFIGERKLMRYKQAILVQMKYKNESNLHHEYIEAVYDREEYRNTAKYRWNKETGEPFENVSQLCQALRKIINSDPSRGTIVEGISVMHPRLIIFYNYNYELEILRSLNYGEGTVVAEWNGNKHEQIPDAENWVYLVQYTAGAEGWNCIETDTIVFYSQNYSYKIMTQSAGRIDRRNTPFKDLYYYHIRSKAPLDMAIDKALKEKRDFNERKMFTFSNS